MRFPEYLHTEATLPYREAQSTLSIGKLEEAETKLRVAEKIRKPATFVGLESEIEKLRSELQSAGIAHSGGRPT